MRGREILAPLVVAVLVSPTAFATLILPTEAPPAAPEIEADAPSEAAPPLDEVVEAYRRDLERLPEYGIPSSPQDAAPGIAGMRLLLDDLSISADSNHTNQTQNDTGTHSHHHADVGDEGLGSVWIAAFHGIPGRVVLGDLDGDKKDDVVAGSEIAVTAVSGATGELLWARHIGSFVTGLLITDLDADGRPEVVYSTAWGGQLPRVTALRGVTGELVWEHIGYTASFMAPRLAETKPGSDILVAATNGTHFRLGAADGRPVWKKPVDLVPSTGAIVAGYLNLGHYLHDAIDVNGDGFKDSVSVSAHYYYAFIPFLFFSNRFAMVQALDGKTGQALWIHPIGLEPASISSHLLTDLAGLDARGDGSYDVAVVGLSFRYYLAVVTGVPTAESFIRVIDGSGTLVGVPLGARSSAGPGLTIERYLEIEPTDVSGDKRDEILVLSNLLLDGILEGTRFTLQRFALPPSATNHPTLQLVSDLDVGFKDAVAARLTTVQADDGRREAFVIQRTARDGVVTQVPAEGQPAHFTVPGQAVHAFALHGDTSAVALTDRVEVRSFPAFETKWPGFQFRGAPRGILSWDHDGDTYPDILVRSSDGNVHVVDGITGDIIETLDWLESTDLSAGVRDLRVVQYKGDDVADYILVRWNGSAEGWDGANHKQLWRGRAYSPVTWFDGNGDKIPDLVSYYDFVKDTLTALNGANGQDLWTAKVEDDNLFFFDRLLPARLRSGAAEDLVVLDAGNFLAALDGRDGKTLWKKDLEPLFNVGCFGAVDHEGDGTQIVYHAIREETTTLRSYGAAGMLKEWPLLKKDIWGLTCSLQGVPRAQPGESLLAGFAYRELDHDAYMNGFGLFDGTSWTWWDLQATPPDEYGALRFLGADASGPDGGRYYFGREDHVFAKRLKDAEFIAEFTVNGPFVVDGTVLDLDRSSPSEAIVVTADGLVWSLADDPQKVLRALDREAVRLGKEPPSGASAAELEGRSERGGWLPGPEIGLVAVALGLVALRLRRRA